MSNFQNPYQKLSWLERRLNSLESLVRKAISPNGIVSGGTTGGTPTVGVLQSHSHKGAGDGGLITYERFVEGAAAATPPSGHVHLYAKADGAMYSKDDAGVESGPFAAGGGGGSVATDTIWDAKGDLAGGTGANTAARLAVGADDTILMADATQATGLKWVTSGTPSTQAFGDAAGQGTTDGYARTDHKHAMPADPVTAHVAASDPHTGYVLESLFDAKGDLITASADNTPAKLTVGANGMPLMADSAQSNGLRYGMAYAPVWAMGG